MNINLCFHGIGTCAVEREPGEARYWVGVDAFRGILDEVMDDPRVRISFDDGNRSDVEVALPALLERGMQADFFVLAGRMRDRASLSPVDVRGLRAEGMRIGSHGWQHRPWKALDAADVRRELYDARVALQDIVAAPVTRVALPLGRYDRHSLRAARLAGYRAVYTSDRYPTASSSWLQARFSVTATDTPASVRRLLRRPLGVREVRNLCASLVKRSR